MEGLLGILERRGGHPHKTIGDIRTWAADPGGDLIALQRVAQGFSSDDIGALWMARRGPLQPFEDDAVTLFDFERALGQLMRRARSDPVKARRHRNDPEERRRRQLRKRLAALMLSSMGLERWEIAEVLGQSDSWVTETLRGYTKRDREGAQIKDEAGYPQRFGGMAREVLRLMNGDGGS